VSVQLDPPGTHWIGSWVDPRAGLDDLEKRKFFTLPGLELRPLSRPARSQSIYQLRYAGSVPRLNHSRFLTNPVYSMTVLETITGHLMGWKGFGRKRPRHKGGTTPAPLGHRCLLILSYQSTLLY
jgi:hypothetical protein